MKMTFDLSGDKSLERQLKAMSRASRRSTVTKAARRGARTLGEEMRRRAPKAEGGPTHPSKGHAAKTIKWVLVEKWPDRAIFAIGPTDWGFYLAFFEHGTVKMAAQPWMRPALDAVGDDAIAETGEVFREAVVKAAMKARGKR